MKNKSLGIVCECKDSKCFTPLGYRSEKYWNSLNEIRLQTSGRYIIVLTSHLLKSDTVVERKGNLSMIEDK